MDGSVVGLERGTVYLRPFLPLRHAGRRQAQGQHKYEVKKARRAMNFISILPPLSPMFVHTILACCSTTGLV